MISYVTYDDAGNLTGAYLQELRPEHAGMHIEVDNDTRLDWTQYRANASRDGVELAPPAPAAPAPDLAELRAEKNAQINEWRGAANLSTFPHAGKLVACDELSRSDIDGVANNIALFGEFPAGFPGGWKATDNTMIPLPDVDAFRALYASMTAQGTENFNHAQILKVQLAAASTPDEIAAITWSTE